MADPAKNLALTPELPEAKTEKPEAELKPAPEIKELTDGTKEKALKVIQGGKEGTETAKSAAETTQTTVQAEPEKTEQQPAPAVQDIQTATAAKAADIIPASAVQPEVPRKKGIWNWFKNGLLSFWRSITGAKKE